MFKRITALVVGLIAAISLIACDSGNQTADTQGEDKIKVSVTFNAMKEFVEAIGQDKVEISTIIPEGSEAHDFEPKAQDLVNLSTAAILVYNGLDMERWIDNAIQSANNENLIVVNSSNGAELIVKDDSTDENVKYDPHLWLGLKGAQVQVINIKEALIQADSDNKDYYEQNCNNYISQLKELYTQYKDKFQALEKKSFVTGHAAFGYLCRDFGLTQNSVMDIFADGEPSAKQLTELVDYCTENNVTVIFAEEMASPAVSQTLADEVGAKVETIYTIESKEDDKTYLERMRDNLSKIYSSLTDLATND